jgi:hypothetical protein
MDWTGEQQAEQGRFRRHHYSDNVRVLDEFLDLLRRHGIDFPADSPFEQLAYSLITISDRFHRGEHRPASAEDRAELTKALGITDFMRKILAVREHTDFSQIVPHLRLVTADTGIVQNFFSPQEDADSNKLFELYIATLVLGCGTDVRVDDPVASSGGRNPDVIGRIGAWRWGVACKTLHSDHPRAFGALVADGVRQIESERVNVDAGLVVVNFKNVIAPDVAWPIQQDEAGERRYVVFDTWEEPRDLVVQDFDRRFYDTLMVYWTEDDVLRDYWARQQRTIPAALNYLPGTTMCRHRDATPVTRVNQFRLLPFKALRAEDMATIGRLQQSLQTLGW